MLFEPAMDPSRAYYGTDTRASGLLLGAALAMVWKPTHRFAGDPEVKTVSLDLVGMAAVAVLIGCFATMRETDTFLYRGGFAVVSVASCVAIMATVHPGTVLGRHVLAHRVLIVDRRPLVLAVPVALADLRVHPSGDRPAADALPDACRCASC